MELKIRKLKEKDAPLMLEWMHDPDVVVGLRKDFSSFTIDHCLNFIANAKSDETAMHRAVVNEEDEYLGTVSVRDIDRQLGCGEFAITVRRKAMGTGAAIFGMRKILCEALNELGLKKVYWCVSSNNPRAVRFYRKNGFIEVKEESVPDYLTKGYGNENDLLWFCYEQKRNGSEEENLFCGRKD
ncbi:MAG: GNAT family N-acetyltransferase [Erysipelotrichaceae bacterium]|nr:GNAT family N-acetyltransferase [Erysipelotrichaceae bacterium]